MESASISIRHEGEAAISAEAACEHAEQLAHTPTK